MFKRIKIGSKISFLVIGLVIVTVSAASFIAYNFSKDSLQKKYLENLNVIAEQKSDKINNYFDQVSDLINMIQGITPVKQSVGLISQNNDLDSISSSETPEFEDFLHKIYQTHNYRNIMVLDLQGKIQFSADPSLSSNGVFDDIDGKILEGSKNDLYFSNVFAQNGTYKMYAGAPLYNLSDRLGGILLLEINMQEVYKISGDTTGLGNTGEIILGKLMDNKLIYLNPLRNDENSVLRKSFFINDQKNLPLQLAISGKNGAGIKDDYRGVSVLAAWQDIPQTNWGLVAKIDTREIYDDVKAIITQFLIAGFVIILVSGMIAVIFSKILINPLLSLKSTLQLVGKGILPNQVPKKTNDELGEMAETVGNLVKGLKRTADFAHRIGEGDFGANFKPLSENDTLGTSLINMRDSIQESEKKDKERNWIVTGLAEIGEILRSHDSLTALGDDITSYITKKINAVQGAFYVVNDEDPDHEFLEMNSSYAYGKKKYLNGKYKFAQGLVGQSAIEQDTLLRTEIPDDYVTITSGLLGDQRPKCILIVPLITDEKVFGALEFAGFEKFNDSQVKFVQELSLIIARTIFNIKVNERTRKLLAESQEMSNELQQQQEILRQNAEEMEATQEELKRTNHRLEEQIEEVNRTQKRMQLLLENASEVITIYEEDGTVRYISPSVEKILGYSQEEMIGEKDIQHVHPEGVEAVNQMFQDLVRNPYESVTIQYVYHRKDGDTIWLEATGNNQLSDPAIQGIIVNSRDITERRRAEQEERMRTKMQALSENSPDLISRLDTSGNVFYINPVIETYTGNKPNHFLNKNYSQVNLPATITEQWESILAEVDKQKQKFSTEMDFPSQMGDRVMQVNAIPEFDDKEALESVLMVSHDITERKLIELEIQSKNKKITESINYAKRIQGAILPDNSIIRKVFPESFILYKARDVVSGDFPWYLSVGDDVFIAAVDCTGHGVPGALISLIGYFLLNDIVRSRKVLEPGKILDYLDQGVTETLRQEDDNSKTKDGMDIALCKINTKNGEVEYAGAHRPLYLVKNGEMEEIKGDRFPIGGGIFKNQTNFSNTKIKVNKGDSIYFCSDGFPDQFGGADNRKFGPKRLREMIMNNHLHPMPKVFNTFDQEWEAWKGDMKQTDDVLLIGIKF
ncbi:MAG: PAS domain S-box protein [Candidatus Cyclobacteriaceae bacterium M3_2C_046]